MNVLLRNSTRRLIDRWKLSRQGNSIFYGIRTPWTLANDVVWERTHGFAGRVFVAGGVIIFWLAFTSPKQSVASLTILAMTILAPLVYSFVV